mmetsp:Transcript_46565/g.109494  ORF Transcript_46565/g.109494 Transcript_46565/m.109494 type:complete len:257 (-) Transcript_46565:220-990(-)
MIHAGCLVYLQNVHGEATAGSLSGLAPRTRRRTRSLRSGSVSGAEEDGVEARGLSVRGRGREGSLLEVRDSNIEDNLSLQLEVRMLDQRLGLVAAAEAASAHCKEDRSGDEAKREDAGEEDDEEKREGWGRGIRGGGRRGGLVGNEDEGWSLFGLEEERRVDGGGRVAGVALAVRYAGDAAAQEATLAVVARALRVAAAAGEARLVDVAAAHLRLVADIFELVAQPRVARRRGAHACPGGARLSAVAEEPVIAVRV